MTFNQLMTEQVELILNRFPEVRWDRWSGEPSVFVFFGWIERKDSHEDFVQILVEGGRISRISTSSAVHSRVFARRAGLGHLDCHRVEDHFKNTKHIKLK